MIEIITWDDGSLADDQTPTRFVTSDVAFDADARLIDKWTCDQLCGQEVSADPDDYSDGIYETTSAQPGFISRTRTIVCTTRGSEYFLVVRDLGDA